MTKKATHSFGDIPEPSKVRKIHVIVREYVGSKCLPKSEGGYSDAFNIYERDGKRVSEVIGEALKKEFG